MQFKTFHSSSAAVLSGTDNWIFKGWIRDVNRVLFDYFSINGVVPVDTIVDSRNIPCTSIDTSKSRNLFRDHDCIHHKYDGVLTADTTVCDLATGPCTVLPPKYRRGDWSYLDYNLPPMTNNSFTFLPLNQDFYLNFWEPSEWSSPDGSPRANYSTDNIPRMQTVKSVMYRGIPVILSARIIQTYSANKHYTSYNTSATMSLFLNGSGPKTVSSALRSIRNVGGTWDYCPITTGFELEYRSMEKGELPFSQLDYATLDKQIDFYLSNGYSPYAKGIVLGSNESITLPDGSHLWSKLDDYFQPRLSKVSYPDLLEFWQLAELAIQDCKTVGINSIDFLRDLPDFGKDILQVSQTISKLSSKKKAIKAIAKQFLALNYGSRLTISDLKELRTSINRAQSMTEWTKGYSKVHSHTSVNGVTAIPNLESRVERNYKVYYNPADAAMCRVMKGLNDIGIYPSGENLWDLVPFSFVVDWFINVGDILSSIDTSNYCIYLDILSCVYSEKYVSTIRNCDIIPGFIGDITYTEYRRDVRKKLHQPKLDLQLQNTFTNHVVELAAIAVSRH